MTSFGPQNWNKPTPKRWRNVGDGIMILGGGLVTLFTSLPLDNEVKVWVIPILTYITIIGKWMTKLFGSDDSNSPKPD